MNKQYFIQLFEFNAWASSIVCDWLKKISDEQWNQHINSSFPSVYKTVLHIAASDKIWLERFNKVTRHELLIKTFNGSKDDLLKIWIDGTDNFKKFITHFPEDKIAENLAFTSTIGIEFNQPYWQLFAHVVNHATYHRGQLVTMLRETGYTDFTSIDMTTYFRTNNNLPS